MYKSILCAALAACAILSASRSAHADAAADTSFQTRMRETLRNTMQQLADAQNQVATLQAAQTQSDKDKTDLTARVDALTTQLKTTTDQGAVDRDASAKSIAALNDQLGAQKKQIDALGTALAQWKEAYNQTALLAKNTEAARAQLAGDKIVLGRLVDDRELKNAQLYKTGMEILDRYEKFGLGDALTAKEPFVGTTRVHLENLVQDYQDKLLDSRTVAGQPPTTPPAPAATKPPAVKTARAHPPADGRMEAATP